MSDARVPSRLPKLPFYFADLVLSAIAVFILYRLGTFEGPGELGVVTAALFAAGIGAWFSIIPWLSDHRAQARVAESANLASALEQIQQVEKVADQIKYANSQWQGVQDSASRTLKAAGEISEKMRVEAQEFAAFLKGAHDQERKHLRLEVEKMKRAEADWLRVLVQIMDHVHALTQAGQRSGQAGLIGQLQQFQNACRDVARRIGLAPFAPAVGEPYEERSHQIPDSKFEPPADAKVGQVLATGYTFQGQLLRRALVLLANPENSPAPASIPEGAAQELPEPPAPAPEMVEPEVEGAGEEPGQPQAAAEESATGQIEPEPVGHPQDEEESQIKEEPQSAPSESPAAIPTAVQPEAETGPEQPKTPHAPEKSGARDFADPFEEIEAVDWEEPQKPKSLKKTADAPPGGKPPQAAPTGESGEDEYPRQLPLV